MSVRRVAILMDLIVHTAQMERQPAQIDVAIERGAGRRSSAVACAGRDRKAQLVALMMIDLLILMMKMPKVISFM